MSKESNPSLRTGSSARKSRKITVFLLVGAVLVVFLKWDAILINIFDLSSQDIVKRSTLRDDIKVGEMVPFKKLAPNLTGTICVLYSYGRKLQLASKDIMSKVNPILEREYIALGESEWAFIVVNNESVKWEIYHEYKDIRMLSPNYLKETEKPSGFEPSICVEVEHAGLLKVFAFDSPYLILGRI